MTMRLLALSLLSVALVSLGCNDSEPIEAVVKVADGAVRLEWSGPSVHSITVGESTGPADEAECSPGKNVWWARQAAAGDVPPLLASPFRVGDTPSGVQVSGTPTLSKGHRYVARFDRNEAAGHARAQGCVGFDF